MVRKKIKGCIINIGSQLGKLVHIIDLYTLNKFAIEGLTKSSSLDLAKYGMKW